MIRKFRSTGGLVFVLALGALPARALAQDCLGWVAVESDPETGGSVLLNGRDTGQKTPATLKDVPCGKHQIEVSRPFYQGDSAAVTVVRGDVTKIQLSLKANFGALEIVTLPPGAKIRLDGKEVGESPLKISPIDVGAHQLQAMLPDYRLLTHKFAVQRGKPLALKLSLTPAFGTIRVTTKPEVGAMVLLNGDAVGSTPLTLQRILSGTHTLTLSKELFLPHTAKVIVKDGKEAEVAAALSPNYGTLEVMADPAQSSVSVDGKPVGKTPLSVRLVPGAHQVSVQGPDETFKARDELVQVTLLGKHKLGVKLTVGTGSLMVDTVPFAADIEVDGKPLGKAPLALKTIPIGSHVVVAKVKGQAPLEGRIEVLEGQTAVAEVNLKDPNKSIYRSGAQVGSVVARASKAEKAKPAPVEAKPKTVEKPVLAAKESPKPVEKKAPPQDTKLAKADPPREAGTDPSATSSTPAGADALRVTKSAERPMSDLRLWAWVSGGVGAAALLTGVILIPVTLGTKSDADAAFDKFSDPATPAADKPALKAKYESLDKDYSAQGTAMVVMLVAGAAASGISTYLFLTSSATSASPAVALRPVPLLGGGLLSFEGRF